MMDVLNFMVFKCLVVITYCILQSIPNSAGGATVELEGINDVNPGCIGLFLLPATTLENSVEVWRRVIAF